MLSGAVWWFTPITVSCIGIGMDEK